MQGSPEAPARRGIFITQDTTSAGSILTVKNSKSIFSCNFQAKELILGEELILFISKESILFRWIMTCDSQYLGIDQALDKTREWDKVDKQCNKEGSLKRCWPSVVLITGASSSWSAARWPSWGSTCSYTPSFGRRGSHNWTGTGRQTVATESRSQT